MPVKFGWVELSGGPHSVTCQFDLENSPASGGTSTIEDVERPKRVSLVKWNGQDPRRQTLALLLDGFQLQQSVRHDLDIIEVLAAPQGNFKPPLKVEWDTGGVLPWDKTRDSKARWWIEDVEWDQTDVLALHANAQRGREPARQRLNVSLVEYVPGDGTQPRSVAQRGAKTGATKPAAGRVAVRAGDTLQRIAERELGNSDRWPEIKALNPKVTNPKNLTGVTSVRLPARSS